MYFPRSMLGDRFRAWFLILIGLGLALGGCGSDGAYEGGVLNVPLDYRPTNLPPSAVVTSTGAESVFLMVTDNRPDPQKIGENREDPQYSRPVMAGPNKTPADLVRAALLYSLTQHGYRVVDNPSSANRALDVAITTFWADETAVYHAHIAASMDVTDSAARILWSGTVFGSDSTFGRSYTADNYNQIFSNAARKLTIPVFRAR
jgi:hypothetical protein